MIKFMCEDGTYKWHKLGSFKVLDLRKFGKHLLIKDSFGLYVSKRLVTVYDIDSIVEKLSDKYSVDLTDYGYFMWFKSNARIWQIKRRLRKLGEIL